MIHTPWNLSLILPFLKTKVVFNFIQLVEGEREEVYLLSKHLVLQRMHQFLRHTSGQNSGTQQREIGKCSVAGSWRDCGVLVKLFPSHCFASYYTEKKEIQDTTSTNIFWSPSLTTKLEVELFKVGACNHTQIPCSFSCLPLWNFSMFTCVLNICKNAQDFPITEAHKTKNQNYFLTLYYPPATCLLSLLSACVSPKYIVYVVLFPHHPFTPQLLQIWLPP